MKTVEVKKNELLKKAAEQMRNPWVAKWYEDHLEGKSQGETIDVLLEGIIDHSLTIHAALMIAFVTGVQWKVKFEGVP